MEYFTGDQEEVLGIYFVLLRKIGHKTGMLEKMYIYLAERFQGSAELVKNNDFSGLMASPPLNFWGCT